MKFLKNLSPAGHGIVPRLSETAQYGGYAFMFGYLQNRYRERASVAGVPADLFTGLVMKGGAIVADLWGGSKLGAVAPYAHVLGNAGLGAYMHILGAGKGAQASGVARLLIDKKDVQKARAALPNATVLGEIPKAPHGDLLSSQQLANLAR